MGDTGADSQLVARVQRGDKKAFDLLVLKYQHRILKLISRYVRDPSDAMDVAQDAFLKAYRSLPNFRGDSAFYTWIYRIAVKPQEQLVAQARRPLESDATGIDGEAIEPALLKDYADAGELFDHGGDPGGIATAIVSFRRDLRTAITLREIEGLRY